MKKRVRIYKSPTGEGQFLNKTAQFLRKAQMGGTPSAEELSYPGAGQRQTQEVDENQLASLIMQDISNSRPKEEIVVKLVNIYGKDPLEATDLVNEMYAYLEQQSEAEKEEDSGNSLDEEVTIGDRENAEEEAAMAPVEEIEEGFYGDDTNNDISNQVADEDDEVEDDDSDVASQIIMMRGGYMRAQEGAEVEQGGSEVESEYPIVFPGVEAYLPANMSDMLSGGYDVATGQAWERPDFKAPETSDDAGISYGSMDPGSEAAMVEDEAPEAQAEEGVAPEENYDEGEFRKGGAYKRGKSAYVNSVLKLVKKQMGGDQEDSNPNDLAKKSDQADPIGNNVRRGILDKYIGTLKNQGEIAVAKEQAEQQYDQMMQQQQQMQQQMMQQSENYPIEEGSLEEAQFGGFFNRRRNEDGYQRRGLFNRQPRVPRIPGGFRQGYPPIESIDVHKRGFFGRPNQYSINFGQMPSVMPGYGVQGTGPGFYGYGYTTGTKKTPARKIVEDNAVYVNSQANKDVAAVTPGNDATNKDVKVEEKKTETVTATPGATATGTTDPAATTTTTTETVKTTPTVESSSKTAKETQVKKDIKKEQNNTKIARPEGAKPEAPMAPRQYAPSYIAPQNRPDLVRDNTRVQQRVAPVNIPKVNLTVKPKAAPINVTIAMAQAKNPLAFAKAAQIKDPAQKAAAMNKIMFPYLYKEDGGIVDDPFTDEYGNLQRFVYGGDEDPSLAYIDQSDIDYSNSEDTTDPYFQNGGANEYDTWSKSRAEQAALDEYTSYMNRTNKDGVEKAVAYKANPNDPIYKQILAKHTGAGQEKKQESDNSQSDIGQKSSNYPGGYPGYSMPQGRGRGAFNALFPANLAPRYSTQYMGARNAAGQQIPGVLGKNAQIKSIDVHKRGILGRPKQYSINFSQESSDPRKQNLITLPGEGAKGSKESAPAKGPGALSQKEMEKGERQAGRQRPLFAGRRYEKDFEEYDLTPEEQKRIDENEARHKANREIEGKQKATAAGLIDQMFNPQAKKPGMTQEQMQNFQQMISNPTGVPSYADGNQYFNIPEIPMAASASTPFSADMLYNMSGPVNTEMAYGGALRKFIPEAQFGGSNPVVYTNNPAMQGVSEVDLVSLNPGIQGLQGGMDWASISSPGNVTQQNNDGTKTYGVDASYKGPQQEQIEVGPGSHQIEQTYEPEGDVSFDYKTNTNVDPQAALLTGNAVAKGALGMVDRLRNRKREKEMYKNLTADNLYATDPSRDRGDYDTNTGLYRPNEMGQTWNSRSKQMGGQNDYLNEDPDYVEGDEVDMTEEELADFIANGGEVEYL